MASVTLRPDQFNVSGGTVAVVGGASHPAVQSDDSDASYSDLQGTGAEAAYVNVGFTTTALPSLAQVRSVTPRVRFGTNANTLQAQLGNSTKGAFSLESVGSTLSTGTIETRSLAARATNADGSSFVQADLDSLQVNSYIIGTSSRAYVYETYLDVVYNEAPVVVVTAPADASTITNDSQPSVAWTYSDPESDVQERYQVKVFSAAQYGAGGFDPSTSTAAWDSGEVLSAATTVEIATVLPNATYRAYVQVADVGSGGRFGAWDYNQFTLNVTGPAVPTFTATADNTLKRVELVATSAGVPAVEFFDFEYSDDSGATWAAVRGATRVAAVGTSATVYDYEAPPNTARQYRAKSGRAVA